MESRKGMRLAAEVVKIGPARQSAAGIRKLISAKGWDMPNLAFWMGISRQHLYAIIKDPCRARQWDLALQNLPYLGRIEKRQLEKLRGQTTHVTPPVAATGADADAGSAIKNGPGFRYHGSLVVGSVVTAVVTLEDMTEEGAYGEVVDVRTSESQEEYLIRFSGGEDWFDPDSVDQYIVETGLVR